MKFAKETGILQKFNFGKALTQELIPEIKKIYRIDSEDIGTLGSSAGGLISLYLGWELNNVFTKAACLSPGIIKGNDNYFQQLFPSKTILSENNYDFVNLLSFAERSQNIDDYLSLTQDSKI